MTLKKSYDVSRTLTHWFAGSNKSFWMVRTRQYLDGMLAVLGGPDVDTGREGHCEDKHHVV